MGRSSASRNGMSEDKSNVGQQDRSRIKKNEYYDVTEAPWYYA
jgi:hypothetical protein